MPIAAAAVGGNEQLLGFGIALAAHAEPPAPDGLHGECRSVMLRTHPHPSFVGTDVIDPVGIGSPEFWVHEVVNLDLDRLAAGLPRLSAVLVRAHPFLL